MTTVDVRRELAPDYFAGELLREMKERGADPKNGRTLLPFPRSPISSLKGARHRNAEMRRTARVQSDGPSKEPSDLKLPKAFTQA